MRICLLSFRRIIVKQRFHYPRKPNHFTTMIKIDCIFKNHRHLGGRWARWIEARHKKKNFNRQNIGKVLTLFKLQVSKYKEWNKCFGCKNCKSFALWNLSIKYIYSPCLCGQFDSDLSKRLSFPVGGICHFSKRFLSAKNSLACFHSFDCFDVPLITYVCVVAKQFAK